MAKLTKIKISYGLSFEDNGVWHKPECGVEFEITPGDNINTILKEGWDQVKNELNKQLNDEE